VAHGLEAIDWSAPWLAPWRERGQAVAALVEQGASCAQALNAQGHAPVRFVPQADLPEGMAYEQFIFDTGCVPTRDGLHDFFNGLVWMRFPGTKQRLNQLQAAQIAASGILPVRGPARDGLTLFDENVAVLQAPDALWEALEVKDWPQVFGTLRGRWEQATLTLFGHALTEKLVYPRKAITAHVFRAPVAMHSIASLDDWMAQELSAEVLAAKPFVHLPVLGVPGWCADNADAAFYEDTQVFRAMRGAADVRSQSPCVDKA
jgi:hypothetical protein